MVSKKIDVSLWIYMGSFLPGGYIDIYESLHYIVAGVNNILVVPSQLVDPLA